MRKLERASLILIGAGLLIPFDNMQAGAAGQITTPVPMAFGSHFSQRGCATSFVLTSTVFSCGGAIPSRNTCDGSNFSPALSWVDVPAGTRSLALILDDRDAPAGTWTHWIIWNVSTKASVLSECVPPAETLENGARQGRNDFGRIGYGGPCPPPGKPHRYFFRLYALDARLDVKAGASRNELERVMKRHVMSQAELMGTYGR